MCKLQPTANFLHVDHPGQLLCGEERDPEVWLREGNGHKGSTSPQHPLDLTQRFPHWNNNRHVTIQRDWSIDEFFPFPSWDFLSVAEPELEPDPEPLLAISAPEPKLSFY